MKKYLWAILLFAVSFQFDLKPLEEIGFEVGKSMKVQAFKKKIIETGVGNCVGAGGSCRTPEPPPK